MPGPIPSLHFKKGPGNEVGLDGLLIWAVIRSQTLLNYNVLQENHPIKRS